MTFFKNYRFTLLVAGVLVFNYVGDVTASSGELTSSEATIIIGSTFSVLLITIVMVLRPRQFWLRAKKALLGVVVSVPLTGVLAALMTLFFNPWDVPYALLGGMLTSIVLNILGLSWLLPLLAFLLGAGVNYFQVKRDEETEMLLKQFR